MDDALRQRLDAIERRQRIVIGLLVTPYVLGALWFLFGIGVGEILLRSSERRFFCSSGALYFGRGSARG